MTTRALPPEKELRECVMQTALLFGWLAYFTWRSDHSPTGFPDVVAVRGDRTLFVELKRHHGSPFSDAQREWGRRLVEAGQDWRLWTWETWLSGEIERELR